MKAPCVGRHEELFSCYNISSTERVNKMSDKEQLEIDDQKQIIQGIRVFSPSIYKKIRFVVQNNHLEGWNPTKKEINDLVRNKTDLSEDYYEVFGENK